MTIEITQDLNEFRLDAVRAFLDQGSGDAKIKVYAGQRPATVNDIPPIGGSLLLVEITLAKPCGVVSNGLLELEQPVSDMAVGTGDPSWARVVAGNGQTAMDLHAGGPNPQGYWEVRLNQETIYAGGYVLLESCQIG